MENVEKSRIIPLDDHISYDADRGMFVVEAHTIDVPASEFGFSESGNGNPEELRKYMRQIADNGKTEQLPHLVGWRHRHKRWNEFGDNLKKRIERQIVQGLIWKMRVDIFKAEGLRLTLKKKI